MKLARRPAFVKLIHASGRVLNRASADAHVRGLTGIEMRSLPDFQAWELLLRAMKDMQTEGGVPDPSRHRTRCALCWRIAYGKERTAGR